MNPDALTRLREGVLVELVGDIHALLDRVGEMASQASQTREAGEGVAREAAELRGMAEQMATQAEDLAAQVLQKAGSERLEQLASLLTQEADRVIDGHAAVLAAAKALHDVSQASTVVGQRADEVQRAAVSLKNNLNDCARRVVDAADGLVVSLGSWQLALRQVALATCAGAAGAITVLLVQRLL